VTLILKPPGKGNWAPVTVVIDGRHAVPLVFKIGDLFPLGREVFRIAGVMA
jgi:hypothetical protein